MAEQEGDMSMGDKERILLTLLSFWDFRMTKFAPPDPNNTLDRVHIAGYRKPVPGDLVICSAIHPFPWLVGWLDAPHEEDGWWIREIGSDRLCHVYNAQVSPIVGLPEHVLLEGTKRAFYERAQGAMRHIDDWGYRFGGVRFDGDTAYISARAPFGGLRNPVGAEAMMALPFEVQIPEWAKDRTVEELAALLEAGGVGTRQFEYVPNEAERARWYREHAGRTPA